MIGRLVLMLMVVTLLVSLLIGFGPQRPVSAQDPLPTPVGQLGGRMPLPTAEGLPAGSQPQNTPPPSGHSLVGAWLFTFAEPDRASAQVVFGDDGIVTLIDAAGNRGAGVWTPNGPQGGGIAVITQEAGESGRSPQIMMLHGRIDVGTPGDATSLVCTYTVEPVDGSSASSETAGPFTATGQRVDYQLILPTLE